METLNQYIIRNRAVNVGKEIVDRWDQRVIPNMWHTQGRAGAQAYLSRYGRRIGEKKLIRIAAYATVRGYSDFASLFWERAFELAHPGVPFIPPIEPQTGSAAELPDIFHT